MEASAELSDGPGRQDEAGQKGNRSAVLGSVHAVRSLAFSLIQSSPKRERGGEKRENKYLLAASCVHGTLHTSSHRLLKIWAGIVLSVVYKRGEQGSGRCATNLCSVGLASASGSVRFRHPNADISFTPPPHRFFKLGKQDQLSQLAVDLVLCLHIKESLAHSWRSAWAQPQCENWEGGILVTGIPDVRTGVAPV